MTTTQAQAPKRVLMIAFHFPPMQGSSGILRTLKYAQYLPEFGWEPLVLTCHPRAYEKTSSDQVAAIPKSLVVERAFAMDTARHLAIRGHYPGWLSIPDRWLAWTLGAIPSGLSLIRKYRPAAIWSTFPVATAHLIGLLLHRMTGLPWIADFRDPMAQEGYPAEPRRWRAYRWIEAQAAKHAAQLVFTTPGALKMYRDRYPRIASGRSSVNENGYDEETFSAARATSCDIQESDRIKLVHSGIVYPSERDPSCLFEAIRRLLANGTLRSNEFEVVLRATGHDKHLAQLIDRYGVASVVTLAPPVPYRDALHEMLCAGGLIVMQATNCNDQIPAKLYEYLRSRRPVLGLTDPAGDTAAALRTAGIDAIARLDSASAIEALLPAFLRRIREGTASVASESAVARSSRRARAIELVDVLNAATKMDPG